MSDILTIGIPAHNEEKTMKRVLTGILENISNMRGYDITYDIVVATNGCTDTTEYAVEEFSRSNNIPFRKLQIEPLDFPELSQSLYPESKVSITILSIPQKGKALAWNAIYAYAKMDKICFFDSDCVLSKESMKLIYDKLLKTHGLFSVVCNLQPLDSVRSFTHRYFFLREKVARSVMKQKISGGGYIIRKTNSFVITLPYDLIANDSYLTTFIATNNVDPYYNGADKIHREKNAIVWYPTVRNFNEYLNLKVRHSYGSIQVHKLLGDDYRTIREQLRDKRTKAERLSVLDKKEKLLWKIMKVYPGLVINHLNKKAKKKAQKLLISDVTNPYDVWAIKRG
jgi:glycosyltransferase involved in cell wall biosynthesis